MKENGLLVKNEFVLILFYTIYTYIFPFEILLMCLQWQVRYQTYGQMISTKRKNDKPEKGLT